MGVPHSWGWDLAVGTSDLLRALQSVSLWHPGRSVPWGDPPTITATIPNARNSVGTHASGWKRILTTRPAPAPPALPWTQTKPPPGPSPPGCGVTTHTVGSPHALHTPRLPSPARSHTLGTGPLGIHTHSPAETPAAWGRVSAGSRVPAGQEGLVSPPGLPSLPWKHPRSILGGVGDTAPGHWCCSSPQPSTHLIPGTPSRQHTIPPRLLLSY